MDINDWKYYNHAAIPATAPHETPDITPITNKTIWGKLGTGGVLLARWTTEFDCDHETNWWYVIKDTPFVLGELKSKRRYEINKGNKNFIIKEINPIDFAEDIYRVALAAYATYPKSYRPNIEHDSFVANVKAWHFYKVYGAFFIENECLCGYACLQKNGDYIDFSVLKASPEKEKLGINAAMVYKILIDHESFFLSGGYICDGARSIQHETFFQDYLEKYFQFRKAYCKLNIIYNPKYKGAIQIAYKFRKVLKKLEFVPVIRMANALLKLEEINRE